MSSRNLYAPSSVRAIFHNFLSAVKNCKKWNRRSRGYASICSYSYFHGSPYIMDFFVIPSFHSHFLHASSSFLFMCALAPLRCHFFPLYETDGPIEGGVTWGHESFSLRNILVCPIFCWARRLGRAHEWRLKSWPLEFEVLWQASLLEKFFNKRILA